MAQTKYEKLQHRLAEQLVWMDQCGENLSGYIDHYGDPGVPPVDKDGTPRTVTIPPDVKEIRDRLIPVPGSEDLFYVPHLGDGGTAIWEADHNHLRQLEQELAYRHRFRRQR